MLKIISLIALVSTAGAFSVPVEHHRGSVAVNQSDILSVADDALPSVGIMIPTNSRPEFVAHALLQISKQAYPKHKLLSVTIIDDSPAHLRVGELKPGKQTHLGLPVEYVVLDSVVSIGKKRSLAADRLKKGGAAAIVHWDDDDLYGADRLRTQLAPIARGEAEVTVLQHTHTYFMADDQLVAATTPRGPAALADWGPHFGTLVYKATVFGAADFPDASEAEDYGFAQRAVEGGARLQLVTAPAHVPNFVAVRHGSNTWEWDATHHARRFDPASGNAKVVPTSVLAGADRAFAARMRAAGVLAALAARRTRDWRHGYVAEVFFRKNDEGSYDGIFTPYNDPSTACPQ